VGVVEGLKRKKRALVLGEGELIVLVLRLKMLLVLMRRMLLERTLVLLAVTVHGGREGMFTIGAVRPLGRIVGGRSRSSGAAVLERFDFHHA